MPSSKSKTPRRSVSNTRRSVSNADAASATDTPATELNSPKNKTDWSSIDAQAFEGFKVSYHAVPSEKKRKYKEDGSLELEKPEQNHQLNPYSAPLAEVVFSVKPVQLWDDTNRYRKFTISNETFAVNDTIFVRADESQNPDASAPIQGWVAKVLEVRAGDEQHVYLRVYWMYRPEDLPCGRMPYHGRNEVIASNDMQIIDATSVEGKALVEHWVENDDGNELLNGDRLIWRQTYNCRRKAREPMLSELPKHCIDQKPCNPDELLLQCTNKSCKTWLHASCIEEDAVRRAYSANNIPYPDEDGDSPQTPAAKRRKLNGTPQTNGATPKSTPKTTPRSTGGKKAKGSAKKPKGILQKTADKVANGLGLGKDGGDGGQTGLAFSARVETPITAPGQAGPSHANVRLIVTDLRPESHGQTKEYPVECLKCRIKIEENDEGEESDRGVDVKTTPASNMITPTSQSAETSSVPKEEEPLNNGESAS